MARYVHGSAPGVAVGPVHGSRAVLHRYEIVGEVLVRRRIADRRPFVDGEVRLIDVLINEDEAGRSLNMVRGIVVSERDLARSDARADARSDSRSDAPADARPWREFAVGAELLLAIGEDLGLGPREGPREPAAPRDPAPWRPAPKRPAPKRPALRLATLDGRRLDGADGRP